eukprot:scpid96502/ scgid0652/ 
MRLVRGIINSSQHPRIMPQGLNDKALTVGPENGIIQMSFTSAHPAILVYYYLFLCVICIVGEQSVVRFSSLFALCFAAKFAEESHGPLQCKRCTARMHTSCSKEQNGLIMMAALGCTSHWLELVLAAAPSHPIPCSLDSPSRSIDEYMAAHEWPATQNYEHGRLPERECFHHC